MSFRCITLLFSLFLFCFLHAQTGTYQPKFYSLSDGLPQSQIYCLHQDDFGVLWIGTQGGGVATFDGNSFEVLSSANGLPGNRINQIIGDDQGRLWFATNKGIACYDGSVILTDSIPEKRQNIRDLLRSNDGAFWVSDEKGLCRYEEDPFSNSLEYFIEDDVIHDIYESKTGAIYVCGDLFFYRWNGSTFDRFGYSNNLYGNCVFEDGEGKILCGTFGNGLLEFTGDELRASALSIGSIIYDGMEDEKGQLWLSTQSGIHVLRAGKSLMHYPRSSFNGNVTECILSGKWGNVWLGTSGNGLARMSILPFQGYPESSLPVYAVAPLNTGGLAFANAANGFARIKNDIEPDSLFRFGKVKALFEDSREWLWAGGDGQGLFVYMADTVIQFQGEDGLSSPFIRSIEEDPLGSIWVGTAGGGITRITPTSDVGNFRFDLYTRGNGLAEDRINDIASDEQGRIWYATRSSGIGVILPEGDQLQFDQRNGLPSNEVRTVEISDNQVLWIGCAGGQIAFIDLKSEVYTVQELEFKDKRPYVLYSLLPIPGGDLWIGSANGVWNVTLNNDRKVTSTKRYGSEDGIAGLEVCSNAITLDQNGKLWVGTMKGLVSLNEYRNAQVTKPPAVRLNNAQLDYKEFASSDLRSYVSSWGEPIDSLEFNYWQNNLSFDIDAVHPNYGSELQYSYYLENLSGDWTPLSDVSRVSLSNLPPGEYTLFTRSCVRGTICSETNPIFIRVLQPFWQTQWFILACVAGGLLIIALVLWRIIHNIRQRQQVRLERLEMERSLLDVEQKALRLQMNPHFIFNTLNSIQGLIAREDNRSARLYLSRFSHLMREILENSLEDRIPLEEELATLKHYLELQQFTHEQCFEFNITVEDGLTHAMVPPLLLQPFAENSILHGIVPRGSGNIQLEAKKEGDHLVILLEDDGIGRTAASALKKETGHRSAGLEVTRERLEALSQSDGERGTIEIIDLEKDGKSTGTLVRIKLPYEDEFEE